MSDAKPGITLDFRAHWCAKHLEPFRAEWPKGAGVAMVKLIDAVLTDVRIMAVVPKDADGKGKVGSLDAVLLEHSPLCCLIGDEKMAEVYREAGLVVDGD